MIAGRSGLVTILDDEPRISISNVTRGGIRHDALVTFTVSLSAACDETVTVNFATADGTALAEGQYVATSGTLTFAPGETTKTITLSSTGSNGPPTSILAVPARMHGLTSRPTASAATCPESHVPLPPAGAAQNEMGVRIVRSL